MSHQDSITLPSATVSQISDILSDFLVRCDITYPCDIRLDQAFNAACYADAARRGLDMQLLKKHLSIGTAIGDTGCYSVRVFIAVWTAFPTHIDDYYDTYSDGLEFFFDRFTRREPQRYKVLDDVASMIHETPTTGEQLHPI